LGQVESIDFAALFGVCLGFDKPIFTLEKGGLDMPEPTLERARERRDYERSASIISAALSVVGSSDLAMRGFATAVKRVVKTPQQIMTAEWLKDYVAPGSPGNTFFKNVRHLHPNVRKRYVAGTIANLFYRDPEFSLSLLKERGVWSPICMLISPSMRCNLKCVGCYASEYSNEEELTEDEVESIITQGEDIGCRFFIMLGGEPFVWRHLLDVAERHHQSQFMVFTNGTMVSDRVADRIVELGNVSPVISIEGSQASTDARRGAGTYDRIMAAMDRLRERGAFFAYSCTGTSLNVDEIVSDEFADLMVAKGAAYGWYFLYMPVGREPDLSLMPSAEQRLQLHDGVVHIRSTRPLLSVDFWGDGPLTGGCLSAGRKYLHINNKGDVEPCVFAHFAADNIKDKSLVDCLCSDFFKDLRRTQPFHKNLMRPCPIIDHPSILKRAVQRNGAYPTHEGAESLFAELEPGLREYAREVKDVLDPVWENDMPWVHRWLTTDLEYQKRWVGADGTADPAEEAEEPQREKVGAGV
jgi:MoaA/NifB/PqqE/SkfB family radical SAM enzyme